MALLPALSSPKMLHTKSTQMSDHVILSPNKIIYTKTKSENLFGRPIYTVNIKKLSSSRLLVIWFLLKDYTPLLWRPQLGWEATAVWEWLKFIRHGMSSANITKMTRSEVMVLFLCVFVYLLTVGVQVSRVISKILPGSLCSEIQTELEAISGVMIETATAVLRSVFVAMTPATTSLHFSLLTVPI